MMSEVLGTELTGFPSANMAVKVPQMAALNCHCHCDIAKLDRVSQHHFARAFTLDLG